MRIGFSGFPLIAGLLCLTCSQATKVTPEYVHAPINLQISLISAQTYSLSFTSDNREGGFSGYGIFTGATSAELNADQPASNDITAALDFCAIATPAYTVTAAIHVGPAAAGVAAGTAICDKSAVILTSGAFVALRARVQRDSEAWSKAAIVQVP